MEETQVIMLRVDCIPDVEMGGIPGEEEGESLPAPTVLYSIFAFLVAALRGIRGNIRPMNTLTRP